MTAKIIPFPSSSRVRPVPVTDAVAGIPSAVQQLLDLMETERTGTRPHWSGLDEYLYEHFRRHGLNVLDAVQKVEAEIAARSEPMGGEDWLLHEARKALRFAKKPKH